MNNNKGRQSGNKRSFSGGNRNSNFKRNNFSNENREMHKTTCTKCGKSCEVPFKPTEGKPVFCKECFAKKKRF